jgi:hypothetical protein
MEHKEKSKCYSCGGKGYYTQMFGMHGSPDFIGDKGFDEAPTIHKIDCSACKGTGKKLPVSKVEDSKKCCGKCLEYGIDGGNLCERYLICDNACTCSPLNQAPESKTAMELRIEEYFYDSDHTLTENQQRHLKSFIKEVVSKARSEAQREILDFIDKNYLEYCRQQNGREDCKNCGLNKEELQNLTSHPSEE